MELIVIAIGVLSTGVVLTSFAFCMGFSIALIYASYSYIDNSENTRSRHYPAFQSILSTLLKPFSRHYLSYTISYRSKENTEIANGLLKKDVKRYLDTDNKNVALFAASPHGLIATASFIQTIAPYKEYWNQVVPCTHKHVFSTPLVREFALWLGAINVTRENMLHQLKEEHRSVYLVPGGCREMVIMDKENPIQSRHQGFLRIAFEEKIPVFPIIHTGQDEVFRSYSCSLIDKIRVISLDLTGYPFPSFFLGPFSCKLSSIVLSPINPLDFNNEIDFIKCYFETVRREYRAIIKDQQFAVYESITNPTKTTKKKCY